MNAKEIVLKKYAGAICTAHNSNSRTWYRVVDSHDNHRLLGVAPTKQSTAWQNAKRNIQDGQ